MTQYSHYLPLNDAASQLGINRKMLSSSINTLNLKTMRGADRRAYLSLADIERIQAFRSGIEKSNPLYAGTVMYSSPQSQSMERSAKAYIKEGFRGESTLYKVVRYIIENGSAIPPKLYTNKAMEKEITSHPLLEKLDQPNNEQSGVDFREMVLGHTLLTGNSFQYIIRAGKKGPPDEIWTLMPDMVHPLIAKPRGITGYDYDAFEKAQNPIDPTLIGHLKLFSADSAVWGQSPVEAGAILVDQNTAARKWNLALLQNYARMPGAWVVPTAMAKNERDKLEEKLKEKMRGYANAGTPPVLDAGLSWQNMAVPPTDMDWLESIRRNSGDIANLYNIPPQLIGDTSASTYNNMDQAKVASYTEAIFPILDRLYALWNNWLLPLYNLKGAYLYYDKESVEVIQEVLQAKITAKIEQATKIYMAGGVDLFTYQTMCDIKPDPNGKGIYRVGQILVSSENLKEYAEQAMKMPAVPPKAIPEPVEDNAPPDVTGEQTPPSPQPAQSGNEPQNSQAVPKKPVQPSTQQGNEQASPEPKEKRLYLHTPGSTQWQEETDAHGNHLAFAALDAHDDHTTEAKLHLRERIQTHYLTPRASQTANDPDIGGTHATMVNSKAASSQVSHLLWECAPGACEFCLENDGQVIEDGDTFINGCSSPDDCHRFCKCSAYQLSVPEDTDISGLGKAALITMFAVGYLASRHDKDVQEQQQQDLEDDGEDEDYNKAINLEARRERLRRKQEYKQFMSNALK